MRCVDFDKMNIEQAAYTIGASRKSGGVIVHLDTLDVRQIKDVLASTQLGSELQRGFEKIYEELSE